VEYRGLDVRGQEEFRLTRGGTVFIPGPVNPSGSGTGWEFDAASYGATGDGVTDDTAALLDAIDDVPEGGTLHVARGVYVLTAPIVIDKAMTLVGDGVCGLHGARTVLGINTQNAPITPPYLVGTVFAQTTPGADGFQITACGLPVHLRDFGVRFDGAHRWTNTGHGINAAPTVVAGNGFDNGLISATWDRLTVFGHDGNHYAYRCLNHLCCTFTHLRHFGGGGLQMENDSDLLSAYFGNVSCNHIYGQVICAGTANGIDLKATRGTLNLMVFIRPQCTIDDMTAEFPTTVAPTSAQKMFRSDAGVNHLTLLAPDFEMNSLIGSNIVLPDGKYFVDPSGLINGTTTGGAASDGGHYSWLQPAHHVNRSMLTDLRISNNVATPNDTLLGFRDVPSGLSGPAVWADGSGAVTGLFDRSAPRGSARKWGLAYSPLDTALVASNGTDWSDVAAAPTLTALTDIANLNIDLLVHAQGTNGVPLDTLVNSVGSGNFTASGAARPTYSSDVFTPSGMGSAFFGNNSQMTSSLSAAPASFTDFYVIYLAALPTGITIDLSAPSNSGGVRVRIRHSGAASGLLALEKQNAFAWSDAAYPVVTGRFQLVTVRYDGADVIYRVDCTPMGSGAGAQSFLATDVWIGGGQEYYLARFVRYQHATTSAGALTDAQMMSVEKFLRAWGTLH
jgi:hypothetical protein